MVSNFLGNCPKNSVSVVELRVFHCECSAEQGFQGQDSSDLIRQIELACAKYTRMISTLLGDSAGLAIGDSDMLTMLVRSLPNDVRNLFDA